MTDIQKERILFMRNSGLGYGAIAAEIDVSENTVKSYCRRNNLNISVEKVSFESCTNCSAPLLHKAGIKKKRFCCDKCRVEWWNSHPEAVKQKALYTFTCSFCKKNFTAYGNKSRKYCSHKCYINSRFKGGGCNDE